MPSLSPKRIFPKLGPKFANPRPQQVEALAYLYEHLSPLMMAELPTGTGKSPIALALGKMMNSPLTVILTATHSLQAQYTRDFPEIVELRGRANFKCTRGRGLTAAEGPCTFNPEESCDSEFYEQEEAFRSAEVVVTNYALYFADLLYGRRFSERRPHLLVCDEGHRLLDFLTAAETVEIDGKLVEECGYKWEVTQVVTVLTAKKCAERLLPHVKQRIASLNKTGSAALRKLVLLSRQLEKAKEAPEDLVVTRTGEKFSASPVWPTHSASSLTSSANFLLLMSATLYGGLFLTNLLGLKKEHVAYLSLPSGFESNRWPVYYRPVAKLSTKSSNSDWMKVGEKCHDIMHSRTNDKGVIHVSSYAQADRLAQPILACPDCRGRLVLLRMGERRVETIDRFRGEGDSWIIHPGLREGESFDDDLCRTQIIAKLPWPDLGEPITKLRMDSGKLGQDYYYAVTAAQIAQAAGRGMRHEKDHAETFILDGQFGRLYDQHRAAFPLWFRQQLRS